MLLRRNRTSSKYIDYITKYQKITIHLLLSAKPESEVLGDKVAHLIQL
jgi:hypothetical protein